MGEGDGPTPVTVFELSSEEIVNLPLDELAVHLLNHLVDEQAAGNKPNRWNVLNDARHRQLSAPARRAITEGMQWLEAKVLVAPNEDTTERDWLMVTRRGIEVVKAGSTVAVAAAERLDVDLHPQLERKVRRQYLMGEYELAAFAAMREVEIRVRALAGEPAESLGMDLMHRSFRTGGPLADPALASGEQVATMELFAGALGVFKNPPSHRQVDYDDPTEAAEVILLADLLMRMLDRTEARLKSPK